MIQPPKKNPTPNLKRSSQADWGKGLVTAGGRLDTDAKGLWVADNAIITPEGSVKSRHPFLKSDIPDLPSTSVVGPIFDYWNPAEGRFDLLCIVDGQLHMHSHGTDSWEPVPEPDGEVEFSMDNLASYTRYGNLIVIADDKNPLAYFTVPVGDAQATVVRPGDQLGANPGMAVSAGEETSDYRAYYVVSYVNDWGETPASGGLGFDADAKVARIKLADDMNPLGKWATEVVVEITGVDASLGHNARVRIYRVLTPDYLGPSLTNYQLVKEFPVSDGDQSFTDDGTVAGRVIAPQLENSTGGLVGRYVTEIDGRLWALGSGTERQKVYYSGAAPTDSLYPQFFTGDGGYFYVAYGTDSEPVTIRRGRADDGQACNICLCTGGRRFNIFSLATTYGTQTIHQFYPSEQKGDEGAYSTFGVLDHMNSILYPSPGGFKSSGIRATYTNDNVTASIDGNIQDLVREIPYDVFRTMYGTVYDGKAMWHISPSSLLVFDTRANGAWTKWTIPHNWFGSLSYGRDRDSLYLIYGASVLRYSDLTEFMARDSAGPEYPVHLASGRLTAGQEDGREWVRLLHVLFVFSALEGPVKITLRANSKRRMEVYTGTVTVDSEVFGQPYRVGGEPLEFSNKISEGSPNDKGEFSSPSTWSDGPFVLRRDETSGTVEVRVRVNKDINTLDWEIESLDGFVELKLENFVYEYVNIGIGPDFSSRYNEVRMKTVRN